MYRYMLITLLLLNSVFVRSQKVINKLDTLVNNTKRIMKEKNIEKYFIFTQSSNSECSVVDDDGNKIDKVIVNVYSAFIFWEEDSKCYLKYSDYMDNNYSYKAVEIEDCDFLNLDDNTIKIISEEVVLPVKNIFHYDLRDRFYFPNETSNEFHEYYLLAVNKKNKNFYKNEKLNIAKLFRICKKIIKEKSSSIY
jgi:hypothetical protein